MNIAEAHLDLYGTKYMLHCYGEPNHQIKKQSKTKPFVKEALHSMSNPTATWPTWLFFASTIFKTSIEALSTSTSVLLYLIVPQNFNKGYLNLIFDLTVSMGKWTYNKVEIFLENSPKILGFLGIQTVKKKSKRKMENRGMERARSPDAEERERSWAIGDGVGCCIEAF